MEKKFSLNYDGYFREVNLRFTPESAGVYTFMECKFNQYNNTVSLVKILYIGQADNIHSRVMGHNKLEEMRRNLSPGNEICINYAQVDLQSERDRIEATLIFEHKPRYNEKLKSEYSYDTTSINNSGKYSLLKQAFTVYKQYRFVN